MDANVALVIDQLKRDFCDAYWPFGNLNAIELVHIDC